MGKIEIERYYDDNGNLTSKTCSKCGKVKDVSEFHKHPRASDGLRSNCKSCAKGNTKKSRERKTPEGKDKWDKQWKQTLNNMSDEQSNEFLLDHMIRITKNKGKTVLIKRCFDCMEYRMVEEFCKNKNQKDGWNKICNECCGKRYEAKVQQALEDIRLIVEANPTKYDYIPGMDIYGIIYLVYNRITKRYYVGQTTISFDIRYSDGFFHYHIDKKEDRDRKPNQLLQQDLELYGEDSFEFNKLFKVASNQYELDKIEAYWIDKLEAYTKGYNRNRGNWFTNRGLEDEEG